jgi:proton-coupled amino acid transporter
MSTPSRPVNISVPRRGPSDAPDGIPASFSTPIGTPDLRALRAHYAGTPPPPNIPPRGTAQLPPRTGSPAAPLVPPAEPSPLRAPPQAIGGISAARRPDTPASGQQTPATLDLDDLPDEEKAKVLRRHLVSKDERQNRAGEARSNTGSDLEVPQGSNPGSAGSPRSSSFGSNHLQREDTEPFPIEYHAPGADVTLVFLP